MCGYPESELSGRVLARDVARGTTAVQGHGPPKPTPNGFSSEGQGTDPTEQQNAQCITTTEWTRTCNFILAKYRLAQHHPVDTQLAITRQSPIAHKPRDNHDGAVYAAAVASCAQCVQMGTSVHSRCGVGVSDHAHEGSASATASCALQGAGQHEVDGRVL